MQLLTATVGWRKTLEKTTDEPSVMMMLEQLRRVFGSSAWLESTQQRSWRSDDADSVRPVALVRFRYRRTC